MRQDTQQVRANYDYRQYKGNCWNLCDAHPSETLTTPERREVAANCDCYENFQFMSCKYVLRQDCSLFRKGGPVCQKFKEQCPGYSKVAEKDRAKIRAKKAADEVIARK